MDDNQNNPPTSADGTDGLSWLAQAAGGSQPPGIDPVAAIVAEFYNGLISRGVNENNAGKLAVAFVNNLFSRSNQG